MFKTWMLDALTRAFPLVPAGGVPDVPPSSPRLDLARGETSAAQMCLWFDEREPASATVRVQPHDHLSVAVRRVGGVPVSRHNTRTSLEELDGVGLIPGYVPDVLLSDAPVLLSPRVVHAWWLTVHVPVDAPPGRHVLVVEMVVNEKVVATKKLLVQVARLVAQQRVDFPVTHWFYADALMDWYDLEAWSPAFWKMFDVYVRNYVAHGNDTLYVPVFTPPLDGVKRPTQLLKVTSRHKGRYDFDWSMVDQWVKRARQAGVKRFEWTHLFSQWGVEHALRIYQGRGGQGKGDEKLLWPAQTPATGKVYRGFLAQFLPAFEKYLRSRKLMADSFFHLSDEPQEKHLPAYKAARALLAELAPWMKVHDALSHVEFAPLVDVPVAMVDRALEFIAAGKDCWGYYCCAPRGPHINRLLDTPLAKVQIQGWLFHRLGIKGFLHWGYNYWYVSQTRTLLDPFTETDGRRWPNWATGDPFVVYPGLDGPLDSIRWEVFAQSLQDMALLQTLGMSRDDLRLQPLVSFADYPRQATWTTTLRRQLLRGK